MGKILCKPHWSVYKKRNLSLFGREEVADAVDSAKEDKKERQELQFSKGHNF